jgi:hypothetical protein
MSGGIDTSRHPKRRVDGTGWVNPYTIAAPSLDAHLSEMGDTHINPPADSPDPSAFKAGAT